MRKDFSPSFLIPGRLPKCSDTSSQREKNKLSLAEAFLIFPALAALHLHWRWQAFVVISLWIK